jgi:hypothetical protein
VQLGGARCEQSRASEGQAQAQTVPFAALLDTRTWTFLVCGSDFRREQLANSFFGDGDGGMPLLAELDDVTMDHCIEASKVCKRSRTQ